MGRDDLDRERAAGLLRLVERTDWGGLSHAYGPAGDVPAQLAALIAGDDAARERAWGDLYGNVWRQGTIYSATVPVVGVLAALATWEEHPDRVRALVMLGDVAGGEGSSKDAVDAALAEVLPPLFERWRAEPEGVRRALLWVLVHGPEELRRRHAELVDATLPDEHRQVWDTLAGGGWWETDEEYDAYCAFEEWAGGG